jgi:hypothetical protein
MRLYEFSITTVRADGVETKIRYKQWDCRSLCRDRIAFDLDKRQIEFFTTQKHTKKHIYPNSGNNIQSKCQSISGTSRRLWVRNISNFNVAPKAKQ